MGTLDAADVLVFEDTGLGMDAARGAGMRVVAVEGTMSAEQAAAADAVVSALDWSIPLVEGWNA
jgi:beta-phosphoglucomutase-like phosphatase (HAD superfamily)